MERSPATLVRSAVIGMATLLVAACSSSSGRNEPALPRRVAVPSTIASDCSRPVDAELTGFLKSLRNNSIVTFPPGGCYGQTGPLLLADRTDLTVDGNGSTFRKLVGSDKARPNNANWRVAGGRRVTLRNMRIEGAYVPPERGTPGQGQFTDHGVSLWGAVEVSVVDVAVTNVDGECLTADPDIRKGTDYPQIPPSRNVTVERLNCTHAGRQGVAATAVDGFVLADSFIDDAQQNAVDIEIDVPGELARNVKLTGNTFGGIYFSAIVVPVGDSPDVGQITIERNKMNRAPDTCNPAVLIGESRFHLRDIHVTDNTFLTISDGIRLTQVDSGSVARNVITQTNPGSTSCVNPALTPPNPVPVRSVASSVAVEANTVLGFGG